MHLAEILRKNVSELRVPTGTSAWVGSVSIGVAARAAAMQRVEDLIKLADEGVYAAKRDGRNCIRSMS